MVKARKTRRRQRGGAPPNDLFTNEIERILAEIADCAKNITSIDNIEEIGSSLNESINNLFAKNVLNRKIIERFGTDDSIEPIPIIDSRNENNTDTTRNEFITQLNRARKLKQNAINLYHKLMDLIKVRTEPSASQTIEATGELSTRPSVSQEGAFYSSGLELYGQSEEQGHEDPIAPRQRQRVASPVRQQDKSTSNTFGSMLDLKGIQLPSRYAGNLHDPSGRLRTRRRLLRKKN